MRIPHVQRFLLTGLLTVFPLWLTWVVFELVLTQLSRMGAPLVDAAFRLLSRLLPMSEHILSLTWLRFILAVVLTLGVLYSLGALASRVIGKRVLSWLDGLIERIPLVQSIYGGTKKLLSVLQAKPEGSQRVVLIDFPHAEMKAVGLVTRVVREHGTGRELAAVYVPTTPNPTSGFFLMVPRADVIELRMSVDEALKYIISMGVVAPLPAPGPDAAERLTST